MAKAERNGKRKKRSTFQTRVPDLGYYFIVTDTNETEANYLYGLRDSLPQELQGRIVIKVSKAKTDELVRTCKEQASMEPQFGQPSCKCVYASKTRINQGFSGVFGFSAR